MERYSGITPPPSEHLWKQSKRKKPSGRVRAIAARKAAAEKRRQQKKRRKGPGIPQFQKRAA